MSNLAVLVTIYSKVILNASESGVIQILTRNHPALATREFHVTFLAGSTHVRGNFKGSFQMIGTGRVLAYIWYHNLVPSLAPSVRVLNLEVLNGSGFLRIVPYNIGIVFFYLAHDLTRPVVKILAVWVKAVPWCVCGCKIDRFLISLQSSRSILFVPSNKSYGKARTYTKCLKEKFFLWSGEACKLLPTIGTEFFK